METLLFLLIGVIIGAVWRARKQAPQPAAKPDVSFPHVTMGRQLGDPPNDA